MQYIKEPPKPFPYVQIFQHRSEEYCERLSLGTTDFLLVDSINCVTKSVEAYARMGSALGSVASIGISQPNQNVILVGTTTRNAGSLAG